MSKYFLGGGGQNVRELNASVWESMYGPHWMDKAHRILDFSSDVFNLDSLLGSDGGLWNPLLNLKHVEEINLKKNRLIDVDRLFVSEAPFSKSLKSLNLSRNQLVSATIDIFALVLLDLSHNNLDAIPTLDYLPNLEVLKLSFNKIDMIWENITSCPKLRDLDLSHNSITIYPSQIEWGIHYFKKCPALTNLQLSHNPFSNWFPEYQYYVVVALPNLQRLDDWELTESFRSKVSKYPLLELEKYDQIFNQRQLYAQAGQLRIDNRSQNDVEGLNLEQIPPLQFFNSQLQHAAQVSNELVECCSLVVNAAEFVFNSSPDSFNLLFGENKPQQPVVGRLSNLKIETTKAGEAVIGQFLQSITLLVEKHENVQPLLLRTLARLCCVQNENLGPLCLKTLGDVMMGNEERSELVATMISESLIPIIQGYPKTDSRTATALRGLATIRATEALTRKLINNLSSLAPCVVEIATFLEEDPDDAVLISIVAKLVEYPANAITCAGQAVPQLICNILRKHLSNSTSSLEDETFVDLLQIAGCCSKEVKKAATTFIKEEIHTKFVLETLKDHFRTPDTSRWPLRQARIVAAMINFLTGLIQASEKGMEDCVDSFHLTDLLLIPLKEYVANPLVLAASCRGILAILNDEARRVSLLEYVTEQIGRLSGLLQYIGGRVYKNIGDLAERHLMGRDVLPYRPSIPEIQFNSNPYMHSVFCGICNLIKFYLDFSEIPYCQVVNETLATKRREKLLFLLLTVPSIKVKVSAIGALSKVPIENFDVEDVSVIIELLRSFRAFSSADAADLAVALLELLRKFVDDTKGNAGKLMRQGKSKETIESVFELLARAVIVPFKITQGEKSKIKICLSCVRFLRAASRHLDFRHHLRSKNISLLFRSALSGEEEMCFSESQDITVERCWTGRDANLLLRSFTGHGRLTPSKKVAFRIVNQIADVLEGRALISDFGADITLKNICQREALPFNTANARKELRLLDESEWSDRAEQQLEFVRARGPEKLIVYLTRLAQKDFDIRLAVERKKKRHSEYWAGRLKGQKEMLERDLEDGIEFDPNLDDPSQMVFYPRPDSFEDDSRWVMMQALQRADNSLNPEVSALYLRGGAGFYGSGTIWDNVACGIIRSSFIVAALLRGLHACLTSPCYDEVSSSVIQCCRKPTVLRKLTSLLEVVELFDCHVGAKFLAVVRLSITLEPHQSAESMDLIVPYDIICQTLIRIFRPFLHVLRQSKSNPLGLAEQIFSSQIATLLSVIARQSSYIKFSSHLSVQLWSVKKTLLRYMDPIVIRILSVMIVYDLQVAAGSSRGTYISHLLESTANEREEMRESAASTLSELIQCCEPLKYSVIEAFNIAQVFQRAAIRRTFLFELLESANCGHYKQAVYQRAERVLQLPVVHHWNAVMGTKDPKIKLVGLTNYSFYFLPKPDGIRNFYAPASQTSEINAMIPSIEAIREFPQMTRLIRGVPANVTLMIGWMTPVSNGTTKEFYDIIICDKLLTNIPLLQGLYALSGPDVESRVSIYKDVVFRSCLKEYVHFPTIMSMAHVVRKTDKSQYMAFHVLTEDKFYEFVVDWRYWFSPPTEICRSSNWQDLEQESSNEEDNERKPRKGLDNFLGYVEELEGQPVWDRETITAARAMALNGDILDSLPDWTHQVADDDRKYNAIRENYEKQLLIAKENLLKLKVKHKISKLHELTFSGTDEPSVIYKFVLRPPPKKTKKKEETESEDIESDEDLLDDLYSDEENEQKSETPGLKYDAIEVIYLDDSNRERWRRGIAHGLNILEVSGHWKRSWKLTKEDGT